jgi:hypothetical protein
MQPTTTTTTTEEQRPMKAITTKYHGATSHRPARIIATDLDGNRSTVPADGDFPYDSAHRAAAVRLCETMRWPGADALVGGTVKHGGVMAWVFSPEQPAAHPPEQPAAASALLARALPLLVQLGDYIGNGPVDPARPDSLGTRCDLIGDIQQSLSTTNAARLMTRSDRP